MRRISVVAIAALITAGTAVAQEANDRPLVEIDENLWATFYDVPSRRFRSIRDEFVRRNFQAVRSDLATSANYLTIEAGRTYPAIAERLSEVASQMMWISNNVQDASVTTASLDQLFGRAHWLLAQHYIYMARQARDRQNNRATARYLLAATHHMERSVLWSNARVSRDVVRALEGLRDLAGRLLENEQATRARQEKPIRRAEKVLRDLGKTVDRPVVLPPE